MEPNAHAQTLQPQVKKEHTVLGKNVLILIPQKGPIDIRDECNGSDPTWVWPALPGRRYDKEET